MKVNQYLNLDSIYFNNDWLRLNEEIWGVKSERVEYYLRENKSPKLEGVLYLDKKGRVVLPPGNSFLPFRFVLVSKKKAYQVDSQILRLSKLLAKDIKRRGRNGSLVFPPGILDGRAFKWEGFRITFGYTYIGKIPFCEDSFDPSIRKSIKKAKRKGYYVKRTTDMNDVFYCLYESSKNKNYNLFYSKNDLILCSEILKEKMISYVAYSNDNKPVAAQVKFCCKDGIGIDVLSGAISPYIKDGISQNLYYESLKSLEQNGTKYFDFCGGNIESISMAKSQWGFPLISYIIIPENSIKHFFKILIKKIIPIKSLFSLFRKVKYRRFV